MILLSIRVFLVLIYLAMVGLMGTIICLTRPFNPNNLKFISKFLWRGIKILGVKVVVRNEDLIKDFPCVIISNHQENMDVFIGARMIPFRTVSIGKKSIIFIPFFGLFYWLSGNILIDRSNRKSALGTMDLAAKQIIDNKVSVWVLAEGTRSKGRGLLPFKKGAFITAIKAQVPIYSIAISTYKNTLDFKKWNAGTIIVEVLPKIETNGLTIEDVNAIKDLAHKLVKEKIAEIDLELKK